MFAVTRMALVIVLAALAVFAVVQDRVTAAGARRYVAAQRAALDGQGPPVTIDAVMTPAIRDGVRQGLLAGGTVMTVGFGAAALIRRRSRA